jgi:hypothetical protein
MDQRLGSLVKIDKLVDPTDFAISEDCQHYDYGS